MNTQKMKNLKWLIAVLCLFTAISCKKDKKEVAVPVNPNEQELITTLRLAISADTDPNAIQYYSYRDIDGDGGNAATIHTIYLKENTNYQVRILLLDETKNPVDSISKDIEENEKNAHQFFYTKIGNYDLTTTYKDFDDQGVPLGLKISVQTGNGFSTPNNKFKVVLKHQPELKPTSGNGNVNLGETDVEVDFPILIQAI